MGRFTSMVVVVFFLGLVLSTTPSKATDCMSVISNVFSCSNFLKNPTQAVPERSCCNAVGKLNSIGDWGTLCKCIQPINSQFLPTKAQQLPGVCNLGAESLPLVKCLVPHSALPPLAQNQEKNLKDGLLPPLPFGPLPPLPFGPLPPLPFPLPPLPFPLPPLPFPLPPLPFPLPPLPFVPPSQQNGFLPPLPFPLPPLPLPPLGPLPPLPPFVPLPPLPFVPPSEKQN